MEVPVATDPLTESAPQPDRAHSGHDRPHPREWFHRLESGPAFLRREEQAHWLADDAGISCGYAYAIVHEYDMRLASRLNGA